MLLTWHFQNVVDFYVISPKVVNTYKVPQLFHPTSATFRPSILGKKQSGFIDHFSQFGNILSYKRYGVYRSPDLSHQNKPFEEGFNLTDSRAFED
jgi:hypothetical protein